MPARREEKSGQTGPNKTEGRRGGSHILERHGRLETDERRLTEAQNEPCPSMWFADAYLEQAAETKGANKRNGLFHAT